MRVGIKQVAERAGVSATTVSHVVNKTRYVSPEVEKRVNDAIKELNYTPNIMARGLRTNTVKTVAVIVQEASTPFFSRVVDEISDVLYKEGYSLLLCTTRSKVNDELNVVRSMLQQQVCGIILAPQQMDFDYRTLCPSKDFPLVFIDCKTKFVPCNAVTCDNYQVSYNAIKSLIQKGILILAIFTAAKIMSYRQEEIDFRDIWMLLLTVDSHVTKNYSRKRTTDI